MAAGGYPASYNKGDIINGLERQANSNTKVFHAGTKQDGDNIVTSGGRVLCVTALGNSVSEAQRHAYAAAADINWKDCYFRKDIGYRAIQRESV